MGVTNKSRHSAKSSKSERDIYAIVAYMGGLFALFFLVLGVANLVSPDVPPEALDENTRICITLILTGAVLIYSFFFPYIGGWVLMILALLFAAIFHFHPIFVVLAGLLLLIGGASVIRGHRYRKKSTKEPQQH
jgi:hypothetical protein